MAMLRSVNLYQPHETSGGFRSWLWAVTKNKIMDTIRKEQRSIPSVGGSSNYDQLQSLSDATNTDDVLIEPGQMKSLLGRAMKQVRDEFESRTW